MKISFLKIFRRFFASFKHDNVMGTVGKFEELPRPIKSENDTKIYKVIKLTNGLKACLVSDINTKSQDEDTLQSMGSKQSIESFLSFKSTSGDVDSHKGSKKFGGKQKMAAAAITVGVGSFSDPLEIPGMAHFVEHMVFMGSKKYPGENDFDSFISKHGGYANASTDVETTTFYFECLNKHLDESLDRFAQFFLEPLMTKNSISREREIVDSEFQMALPKDAYRKEQLLMNLINPEVPINQFTWGNLQTLKNSQIPDDQLYEKIHEFRKRHYSSHRITLAVQGIYTIEELQEMVIKHFSKVPNNNLPPKDFEPFRNSIFDHPAFKKIYYMQPIIDITQIDISWALPPIIKLYKTKPVEYICFIIGDEGKSSLCSYLKKKMWALGLSASVDDNGFENCSLYAILTISIILTEQGRDNMNKVIEAVFAYINMMKHFGPKDLYFKELKVIEDTAFKFYEEQDAADIVEDLSVIMQYYPPLHYLTGPNMFFEYEPKVIVEILDMLSPDKMNVIVMTRTLPESLKKFDKLEPWFKTSYAEEEIREDWVQHLKGMRNIYDFSLPEPNRFLTDDFRLFDVDENSEVPVKIIDTRLCELWFKQDDKFRLPIACYNIDFITPYALDSPKCACLLDLFRSSLDMMLMEEAYPAYVAELNYSIATIEKGFNIKVDGYNSKLPVVIDLICKYIVNFPSNLTQEFFEVMKTKQQALYYNTCLKPSYLLRELRISLLQDKYFTVLEKHCCIDSVTYDELISFSQNFLKKVRVKALVMGNVTAEIAKKTVEKVLEKLECQPAEESSLPAIKVAQLPLGDKCCRIQTLNKEDNSTIITNYYQAGPYNMETNVIIELLMLLLEEPLFNALRTRENLGYSVNCQLRDTEGILGYTITVHSQATKFEPSVIDHKIEEFISEMGKELLQLKESKLEQYKKDLIRLKALKEVHLDEEVEKFWNEIIMDDYLFDRSKQEIEIIKKLSLKQIQDWYKDHNGFGDRSKFRKMTFQIVGTKEGGDTSQEVLPKSKKSLGHCSTRCAPKSSRCAKLFNLTAEVGCSKKGLKLDHNLTYLQDADGKKPPEYFIKSVEEFKKDLVFYAPKKKNTA